MIERVALLGRLVVLRAHAFGMTHGPQLVSILLAVLILADLASASWNLMAARREPRMSASLDARRFRPADSGVDAAPIIAAHLFGIPPTPALEADNTPPDSTSGWILAATLAREDSKAGFAIIGIPGRAARMVRAGGVINQDTALADVFTDHVVLRRAGVLETLWMTQKSARRPRAPAPSLARADEKTRYGDAIKLEHGPFDPEAPAAPYPTPVISKLHVMPMVIDNHLFGYTVAPRVDSALKGLPNRAIVTQVNGVPLDSGATAQRMFDSLTDASTAVFTIRDGDSLKDVSVDLSGLPAALAPKHAANPSPDS